MKMVALKRFNYGTRHLLPGEEFEAKKKIDYEIFRWAKKARPATREIGALDSPPENVARKIGPPPPFDPERDALRAEAEKLGIVVDGRWGPARLRQEIDSAKMDSAAMAVGAAIRAREGVS